MKELRISEHAHAGYLGILLSRACVQPLRGARRIESSGTGLNTVTLSHLIGDCENLDGREIWMCEIELNVTRREIIQGNAQTDMSAAS